MSKDHQVLDFIHFITDWWLGTFLFSHILGIIIPIDYIIFFRGVEATISPISSHVPIVRVAISPQVVALLAAAAEDGHLVAEDAVNGPKRRRVAKKRNRGNRG